MNEPLQSRLDEIANRLLPEFHAKGKADLERLQTQGVHTYTDLLRLVIDTRADDEVRVIVLWVLARLEDEKAVAAMLVALEDASPDVRAAAAKSLGELNTPLARAAIGTLITLLDDENEAVRRAAAYALGMLGDERGLAPLLAALENPNETAAVRGVAAEALAELRDTRAIPTLLNALSNKSAEIRYWAAFALGEIGDPSTLVRLHAVALADHEVAPDGNPVSAKAAAAISRIEEQAHLYVLGVVREGLLLALWPPTVPSPLQLTTISARLAQTPEPDELGLSEHEGCAVIVQGYLYEGWLYHATLVEVGSPDLSAIMWDMIGGNQGR